MKFLIVVGAILFLPLSLTAETEEETINKCLQDLSSEEAKVRRRAVLILCKYTRTSVYRQLLPHLDDPDAKVRQSIVVGFIESGIIMREAARPLVKRLKDADVHTRRMLSSALLPRLIFYLSYNSSFAKSDRQILIDALSDEDVIVRKNMLLNYHSLKRMLSLSAFTHLLGDESAEIRLMALGKMSNSLTFDVVKPYLNKLIHDKNVKIRKQVLQSLGRFGHQARAFLAVMAEDEEMTIAARAMAYSGDPQYRHRIEKAILDESSPSDLVVDLTRAIVGMGDDSQNFVIAMLKNADESRRYAALNALSSRRIAIPLKNLLTLVKDDSFRIRQAVLSHLSGHKLSVKDISALSLSEYSDVREFSLHYVVRHYKSSDQAMLEALYDLMLDEELKIRSLAISAIWECEADDRYDILSQSLTDDEAEIRSLAARILLNSSDPQALKIINDFKGKKTDIDIAYLEQLNRVTEIRKLAVTKPSNWRQQVKDALLNENMEMKKAAVDVIVQTRDPDLFNDLRALLDRSDDKTLINYLFQKIAAEENRQ